MDKRPALGYNLLVFAVKPTPRIIGAHSQVDAIRDATTLVLGCRKEKRYDALALEASAKLLKVVPEVRYGSMWVLSTV